MMQGVHERHVLDADGRPAGGVTTGTGIFLAWQDGPLGRGEDRVRPNGAFVEDVIAAAKGRIEFYQRTEFQCHENAMALSHLELALEALDERTKRRESEGTEGTHEGA